MTVYKIKGELRGSHVHTKFYSAPREGQTFAYLGRLTMEYQEFEEFTVALKLGEQSMLTDTKFITVGDKNLFERLEEAAHEYDRREAAGIPPFAVPRDEGDQLEEEE